MENIVVKTVPYSGDNFCYLIHNNRSGGTHLMDCGEASPVVDALNQEGWHLNSIFLTHFHADHSAGVDSLKSLYPDLDVFKPAGEKRISIKCTELKDSDEVELDSSSFQAIAIPAHTNFCTAYLSDGALFVGDALFSGGCGRLFEGSAADLMRAMDRLAAFSENTRVYMGHEYTLSNLKFALSIEPGNLPLKRYYEEVQALRENGKFSTPSTIGLEKKINPFLRIDEPEVINAIDPERKLDRIERIGLLRKKKDSF